MNKYQAMWHELKNSIRKDLEYHKSGIMQSLAESCHGQNKCEEFLNKIEEIEKRYNN